jgi:RNA polymerase sigma factor (sigma-70 family)
LVKQKPITAMTAVEFTYSVSNSSRELRPLAMRLTRNPDDANDLLQDTMLKALLHREKFLVGTNLKAWLYTIMRNTFITGYQKVTRQKSIVKQIENNNDLFALNQSSYNLALGTFVREDVNRALLKLAPELSEPFLLHYKGYKYNEIGDYLNLPLGTVKNRIHLARKQLKTLLSSHAND